MMCILANIESIKDIRTTFINGELNYITPIGPIFDLYNKMNNALMITLGAVDFAIEAKIEQSFLEAVRAIQ